MLCYKHIDSSGILITTCDISNLVRVMVWMNSVSSHFPLYLFVIRHGTRYDTYIASIWSQ